MLWAWGMKARPDLSTVNTQRDKSFASQEAVSLDTTSAVNLKLGCPCEQGGDSVPRGIEMYYFSTPVSLAEGLYWQGPGV